MAFRTIALTQGYVALVDEADYKDLMRFKWFAVPVQGGMVYAARNVSKVRVYMHTVISGTSHPDHRDGNGLNNQRHNLRNATVSQNAANTRKQRLNSAGSKPSSRFKGVSWDRLNQRWRGQVYKDRKRICLGYFRDEVDAARAYNLAAARLHGEFARLNLLDVDDQTLALIAADKAAHPGT